VTTLLQPARWRQQPSGPTELDQGHPLARGLVFATIGNVPGSPDLIGGARAQPLGTASVDAFANGLGYYSPSTAGNGWSLKYDVDTFQSITTAFTIACEFACESLADASHIVSVPYANGTFVDPKISICLRRATTTTNMMIEIGTNPPGLQAATFSSGLFVDTISTYVAVRDGIAATIKRNNVPLARIGSGFTDTGIVGYSTASEVTLLNRSSTSPGYGVGGGILWCYIWNRALSDDEQASIYNTPYDFIRPLSTQRFYLPQIVLQDEWTGDFSLTLPTLGASVSAGSLAPGRSGATALTAPKPNVVADGGFVTFVPPARAAAVGATINIPGLGVNVSVSRPLRDGAYALSLPAVSASFSGTTNIASSSVTGSILLPGLTVAGDLTGAYAPVILSGNLAFPPLSVLFRASTILSPLDGRVSAFLPRITAQVTGRPVDPLNDPGVAHVMAPPWRTVDFGDGTATTNWLGPLDPSELKAYTIDCGKELDGISSAISSVTTDLSSLAVLAGLKIFARTNDGRNITIWLYVDEQDRAKSNWNGPGELHTTTCKITSSRGQVFERIIGLTIKKLGGG
jgi:hypothetical protein